MNFSRILRHYRALMLLFVPPLSMFVLLILFRLHPASPLTPRFPFLPWQFLTMIFFGSIATLGGVLDWRYHRNELALKMPAKERRAEALVLGLGGVPLFALMWLAMLSDAPRHYLIPILIVLLFIAAGISYDEFVFHKNRCGPYEHLLHRILVFGNGTAFFLWFHYIYG